MLSRVPRVINTSRPLSIPISISSLRSLRVNPPLPHGHGPPRQPAAHLRLSSPIGNSNQCYYSTTTTTHTTAAASPSTGKRPVDVKVEDLSELYALAKDEFEIAVEETSKNTIYARDDRETAREEFEKFKSAYEDAVAGSSEEEAVEIKRRVGQRLREMESAMETLNEADREEH
ncbi:hypothetical protein TWF730_005546 [Orbilia blumenaviensis]|uniref:Uncharacterized protein n=1 Tax=Orbilia blumenaviensis TaxID=1796055 RepID=A0AAV9VLY5_9PEZI